MFAEFFVPVADPESLVDLRDGADAALEIVTWAKGCAHFQNVATAVPEPKAPHIATPYMRQGTSLSPAQVQVLVLIGRGLSDKNIARRLGVSLETVKKHASTTYRKLRVANRIQAALWLRDNPGVLACVRPLKLVSTAGA